jgi:hypothetical protein
MAEGSMFVLFVLGLFLACLIVVPLLLVGLALRLAIAVVLFPFRIAGLAIGLAAGLAVGLVGLLLAGAILLIPLLPVIAFVGGIWLIVRLARRQPAAQLATD